MKLQKITEKFKNEANQDKVSASYLFYGDKRVDLLSYALMFSKMIMTKNIQNDAEKEKIEGEYKAVVGKTKGKTPPRTLIVFGTPGSFSMATSKSFSGDLLTQLGAVNIADGTSPVEDSFVPLSMEYIVKQDPQDILFISMMPDPTLVESFKKDLAENSLWQGVTAVKTGHVYYLSGDLFSVNPGTRIAKALSVLYTDLYENGGTQ